MSQRTDFSIAADRHHSVSHYISLLVLHEYMSHCQQAHMCGFSDVFRHHFLSRAYLYVLSIISTIKNRMHYNLIFNVFVMLIFSSENLVSIC